MRFIEKNQAIFIGKKYSRDGLPIIQVRPKPRPKQWSTPEIKCENRLLFTADRWDGWM